ncbi:osmoprotectant transport system permease protein [Pseudonocardia sediminis]|uniref:Osmoprotectant transport system permease protein n=1 Tax=Pseudonocardia sediminis TaxID=1397368 RepID=A0A4Q7UU52_PSEST|nr:ABC transporter permease [Pseudonocardia sediminis]RZT84428.1 osmoprotectant transport system permease protein [Pseudonocardia sediminis]
MSFWEYLSSNYLEVIGYTVEHALLVLQGLVLAVLIGVPLAVLTYRTALGRAAAINSTSLIMTIPSYALFGLLIPLLGLGTAPAIVALTLYGLLPVVRNAIVGLREVDPAVAESARGVGMDRRGLLLSIELPLAWPVVLAGVRVSAQLLLGIAAISAAVNGPGLGNLILSGLSSAGTPFAVYLAVEGILGIVLLAIVFDAAIALLTRLTTPRGIRA